MVERRGATTKGVRVGTGCVGTPTAKSVGVPGACMSDDTTEVESGETVTEEATDEPESTPDARPDDPVAAGDTAGYGTVELDANGLSFECLVEHPAPEATDEGGLAVCLHGFPDDAGSMVPLLDALAEAGYTAVAPYMRGYAPTDPAPDGDYTEAALGADAVALLDAAAERFDRDGDRVLVGHDWGAVATYAAAASAPDAMDRLVAMAVPPLFESLLTRYPKQVLRSWYMWFFQLPGAPERALRWRDFELVEFLWGLWSPAWDYRRSRIESVKATLDREDTVEHALSYYRQIVGGSLKGMLRSGPPSPEDAPTIEVPGLLVTGARDGCIGTELFDEAHRAFEADCRVLRVNDAGHFVHQERPTVVGDEVVRFVEGEDGD
jgi:pimeloyl-ACP methyl ester carboxylesterase